MLMNLKATRERIYAGNYSPATNILRKKISIWGCGFFFHSRVLFLQEVDLLQNGVWVCYSPATAAGHLPILLPMLIRYNKFNTSKETIKT